ncbi:hypothetical protein BDN72DRAFT_865567, partial [Pluteus cervinus]
FRQEGSTHRDESTDLSLSVRVGDPFSEPGGNRFNVFSALSYLRAAWAGVLALGDGRLESSFRGQAGLLPMRQRTCIMQNVPLPSQTRMGKRSAITPEWIREQAEEVRDHSTLTSIRRVLSMLFLGPFRRDWFFRSPNPCRAAKEATWNLKVPTTLGVSRLLQTPSELGSFNADVGILLPFHSIYAPYNPLPTLPTAPTPTKGGHSCSLYSTSSLVQQKRLELLRRRGAFLTGVWIVFHGVECRNGVIQSLRMRNDRSEHRHRSGGSLGDVRRVPPTPPPLASPLAHLHLKHPQAVVTTLPQFIPTNSYDSNNEIRHLSTETSYSMSYSGRWPSRWIQSPPSARSVDTSVLVAAALSTSTFPA